MRSLTDFSGVLGSGHEEEANRTRNWILLRVTAKSFKIEFVNEDTEIKDCSQIVIIQKLILSVSRKEKEETTDISDAENAMLSS